MVGIGRLRFLAQRIADRAELERNVQTAVYPRFGSVKADNTKQGIRL